MRAKKDSGIEWIGQIPQEWDIRKIKHCFNVYAGATPKSGNSEFWDGDIVWVTPADYTTEQKYVSEGRKRITSEGFESCSTEMIPAGSLIFSKRAPIGLVAINTVDLCTNQGCLSCIPFDENDVEYFYYALSCFSEQFDLYGSGTTFKEISADAFVNFPIPCPDFKTQQDISEYLRGRCAEIDALIEAKEKTNALLRERRQSIIYEAVTKGLNPDAPMKDSGIEWIGEIPIDWDVFPVKYLLDKKHPYPIGDGDHGMIKADDYLSEGIPYVRVLNLTWGDGLNLETLVYISEEMNNRIKNSELKPNDILIAKTGATIGKTAIVPESLPRSNTTSHVGKITISNDHDPKFFYYVMTSSVIQTQIQILSAMQSTRPELGIDGLRNLLVVVPPVEKQQEIATYLNHQCAELNSAIATNASMIEKLKEYRQSVIYEAVTGKIEI